MASTVTAFRAGERIAGGEREAVTRLLAQELAERESEILVFDDATGRVIDLDHRGVMKSAGRPRLGVQAREVTLLPRHWDWLAGQPGGASAALRRLVEKARMQGRSDRERKDAAYRFMQAACGDMPGYEEALRALYRSDEARLAAITGGWPEDVRRYIGRLFGADLAERRDVAEAARPA